MIAAQSSFAPQPETVLFNARLVCPSSGRDERGGILIKGDAIADIGPHIDAVAHPSAERFDCGGHVLSPGLIDMQVFTGEPGEEHRETLATASRAAAAGGVTTIICMPDTKPAIDDVALVDFIERRARDTAIGHVHPMAAMTTGPCRQGDDRDRLPAASRARSPLRTASAPWPTPGLMRIIFSYAREFNALGPPQNQRPRTLPLGG